MPDDPRGRNTSMSALILLVDDDVRVLERVSRALREAGFQVNTEVDGEAALDYMREAQPDLVVTDWQMTFMNGDKMVVQMAADPVLKTIPVVMHSSLWQPKPKGAEDMKYWNSPKGIHDEEDLLHTVKHVLNPP